VLVGDLRTGALVVLAGTFVLAATATGTAAAPGCSTTGARCGCCA
jgi:hypothetical protein